MSSESSVKASFATRRKQLQQHELRNSAIHIAISKMLLGSEIRPTRLRIALKALKHSKRAVGDAFYDFWRYYRYSSTFHYATRDNLRARVTAIYHNVEKGLSLPEPEAGFGRQNVSYLLKVMDEYINRFGIDGPVQAAGSALNAYLRFNRRVGSAELPEFSEIERVLLSLGRINSEEAGGTITISGETIRRAARAAQEEFFSRRYSIRQFSEIEVDAADINAAIEIALKSPAVCNRQDCFVYVVHDKLLITDLLAIQGGARGFSHRVNKLLVVTNRLTSFWGSGERNQCWIDGGLFAMSLILGLHAKGLGTCCLNWCKTAPEDEKMRKLLKISLREVVIMLIAVGHVPETLEVARSARKSLELACQHILAPV